MDEKLNLIESLIYLFGKHYWSIGLTNTKGFVFNPIVVTVIPIVVIIRNILLIINNDKYISKILADFSHDWEYGIQWKILEILWFSYILSIQIIAYNNNKDNDISKIISTELFERKIDQKVIPIFKRIECFAKYYFIPIISQYFFLIINSSFEWNILLITSIFWIIIFSLLSLYVGYIYVSKLILFILYCYRSKILLKIENNLLNEMIIKYKSVNYNKLLYYLKRTVILYNRISNWNKIWSKFIAINIFFFTPIVGVIVLQLYIGFTNISIKIFMIFLLCLCFLYITLIMQMSSNVNTESKLTHKLLTKLYLINCQNKSMGFRFFGTKFKVYIYSL